MRGWGDVDRRRGVCVWGGGGGGVRRENTGLDR